VRTPNYGRLRTTDRPQKTGRLPDPRHQRLRQPCLIGPSTWLASACPARAPFSVRTPVTTTLDLLVSIFHQGA
jgi:hypothetical protein